MHRREFFRFLAASPLFAQQPLSIMDFEPLARKALPPAHWGYLATGVNDDRTLHANSEAMNHYNLRVRQLAGIVAPDLKTEVFGEMWESPIYLSAVGHQKQFHADGELATARASRTRKTMQMLSTVATTSVEDVARERGAAPWFQLYIPKAWDETEKLLRRVEAAGCKVLVWTVDNVPGRNTETLFRFARTDTRNCMTCHTVDPLAGSNPARNRTKPMFTGLSGDINPVAADWSYLDKLKKLTSMKIVIKGIDTAEDALIARERGADGVVVSNHGGRASETGRGTMDVLPEVVEAVNGKIPVFIDGGFRRGTDVVKALALGARAVGIGRPYIWGLSAFGQPGVERVLEILNAELTLTMRQCGAASIAKLTRSSVVAAR